MKREVCRENQQRGQRELMQFELACFVGGRVSQAAETMGNGAKAHVRPNTTL